MYCLCLFDIVTLFRSSNAILKFPILGWLFVMLITFEHGLNQARSQDLEKGGGGYFERVRSMQTTLTRIFIELESVSDGLSKN